MKILVTGGAGFMGSNFIHYMLKKYPDYQIVNLDKLTYAGNLENLADIEENKNYSFIKGDIADEKIVDDIVSKGVDIIVNYAAETHNDRSIMNPGDFVKTDVIGVYTLLEAVKKHNVEKFVQISTDEVYGSIKEGKFTEESPLKPNSPYSASKAGGDLLIRSYYKTYELPVIITRSCNNFGAYQYPEKVWPLFITNLIEGKKVPLYGDGSNVREWIYVLDHASAVDFILHNGEFGEVYNIGSGDELNNIELTKKILALMNQNEDMIEYVKDRPGHDWRYSLDSSKLIKLGWEKQWDFDEALKMTVSWYEHNDKWWKNIKSGDYKNYYKKQYQER